MYILELIHTPIHTYIHVPIVCTSSKRRGVSCHFARFTLVSDLSSHILYSTHSTHCLFTLVVNYINYNYTSLSSSVVNEPQAMQRNDLAERNKTLTRVTILNKDTIN